MYIVMSITALLILVITLMLTAWFIVEYITKNYFAKDKKQPKTKEEKIWEQLKESQEDTSKNSSQ